MRISGVREKLPLGAQRIKRIPHQYLQKMRRRAEIPPEEVSLAAAHCGSEALLRRAEEREYRLLGVAEVDAHSLLRRQAAHDLPLERIQILHLVDHHPAEPALIG